MPQALIDLTAVAAQDDTADWSAANVVHIGKRADEATIDAAIKAADLALANSRKTPAEKRVEHFEREAKRYAESVTRGLGATDIERKSIGQRYLIGLLTRAFLDANADLGEALDLLESEAREIWTINGKPAEQEYFEAAWQSEQPKLFAHWQHLSQRAGWSA